MCRLITLKGVVINNYLDTMNNMRAIDIFLKHPIINGNGAKAARLLGVKQQTAWRWQNRKTKTDMPLHLVPKAADILGMKPSEFIALVFE
jgi:hypothetical protein